MDAIPFEFVNRLLCHLDKPDIRQIRNKLSSALWSDAARAHFQKLQTFNIVLQIGEKRRLLGNNDPASICFTVVNTTEALMTTTNLTFDDLLQMDQRYVRVDELVIHDNFWDTITLEPPDFLHRSAFQLPLTPFEKLATDRISELFRFVLQFRLAKLHAESAEWIEELLKHEFTTRSLHLHGSGWHMKLLRRHLENEELSCLFLEGQTSLIELHKELIAFVCRPQFVTLHTDDELRMVTVKPILIYWRGSPWSNAKITFKPSRNLTDDFGEIMEKINSVSVRIGGPHDFLHTNIFREENGNAFVQVKCGTESKRPWHPLCEHSCEMTFGLLS